MEKSPQENRREEGLPPGELAALRSTLRELVGDLPGAIACFGRENPQAACEYREAGACY